MTVFQACRIVLALAVLACFLPSRVDAQNASLSVNLGSALNGPSIDIGALAESFVPTSNFLNAVESGDAAQRVEALRAYQLRRSERRRRARLARRLRTVSPTRGFNPGYYIPSFSDSYNRSFGFVVGPRF